MFQLYIKSNVMNKYILPDTKFFFTEKICFSFAVINFYLVIVPYINNLVSELFFLRDL